MEQSRLGFARDERFDVGAYAQPGSVTSKRAAEHLQASGVLPARMARLLEAYAAVGVPGLAMFEVCARTGLKESGVCSARAGAIKKGYLLALADIHVSPDSGLGQAVHRITYDGLEALKAWKARQG